MENKIEQENLNIDSENIVNNVSDDTNSKNSEAKNFSSMKDKIQSQNITPVLALEERIVKIKKISKTTKGGRMMRFSALVVVGDKNGTVGFGMGKSNEVPDAIKKAIKNANNNLFKVKINKRGTVFHEVIGHHGASRLLLKPAPIGKGIVAGGAARAVVELAGYQDIYTKSLGSNCPINIIRATIDGLNKQFSPLEIARLRDKNLSDL